MKVFCHVLEEVKEVSQGGEGISGSVPNWALTGSWSAFSVPFLKMPSDYAKKKAAKKKEAAKVKGGKKAATKAEEVEPEAEKGATSNGAAAESSSNGAENGVVKTAEMTAEGQSIWFLWPF